MTFDAPAEAPLPLAGLDGIELLLPSRGHFLRQLIEASFARARVTPKVAGEIESVSALAAAVSEGLGSTVLPASVAGGPAGFAGVALRRLVRPVIEATVSRCVSDHLPLSVPALAARAVLLDTVGAAVSVQTRGLKTV